MRLPPRDRTTVALPVTSPRPTAPPRAARPVATAVQDAGEGTELGPPAAFGGLVHAHYGRLCDFAYHLVRSRAVAEDLVQDVFVAILERGASFSYDDPMPYLFQATRHRALSHLRKLRVRERFAAGAADRWHAEPSSADSLERHELARALDVAIAALPTRCRQIFILSRGQRMTYAEIARALGISVKTVETQMGRALRTLRTRVAPFLSVALLALGDSRVGGGLL